MVDLTTSHYSAGTATVAAGGTVVIGQGTAWAGAVRPGDLFGTHVGLPIRIQSVESNTGLTLAHPWPGAAQTAAAHEIQCTPYDVGYRRAIEDLVTGVGEGNLPLLAALVGAADKIPYFDNSNSMATADFPAWARSMLSQPGSTDKIPYLTGANGAALTTLTSFARSLLDDADSAAARETLDVAQKQANATDVTAGRGLVVGAFGLGVNEGTGIAVSNAQAPLANGFYRLASDAANHPSPGTSCSLIVSSPGVSGGQGWWKTHIVISPNGSAWTSGRANAGWSRWVPLVPESGSNANGEYVRFGDGTQICSRRWRPSGGTSASAVTGINTSTAPFDWVYPVAFASAPVVAFSFYRVDRVMLGGGYAGNTATQVSGITAAHLGPSLGEGFHPDTAIEAVGRWL